MVRARIPRNTVWSDTLLAAERHRALTGAIWGACSLAFGLAALLIARRRPGQSPLVLHFGGQMLLWGAAVLLLAVARLLTLEARDFTSAVRLERMLWFGSGLEIGIAGVGLTVAVASGLMGRRLSGVGAGLAIALHGAALAVLDVQLATAITR